MDHSTPYMKICMSHLGFCIADFMFAFFNQYSPYIHYSCNRKIQASWLTSNTCALENKEGIYLLCN